MDRIEQAGFCEKGDTWDELHVTDDADVELSQWSPEDRRHMFLQHWAQVPRLVRNTVRTGISSQGVPVLVLSTRCRDRKTVGLIVTYREYQQMGGG